MQLLTKHTTLKCVIQLYENRNLDNEAIEHEQCFTKRMSRKSNKIQMSCINSHSFEK